MTKTTTTIRLSAGERRTLQSWRRAHKTERRVAERAHIILLAARGMSNLQIAAQLSTRPARVSKWRTRFARQRLDGLADEARSANRDDTTPTPKNAFLESSTQHLRADTPPGQANCWRLRWTTSALNRSGACCAAAASRCAVAAVWCQSTDPQFSRKAANIVGLYLDPPENAVVLAVDEKPHIQALERAQGWLRLPDGKALTGFSHGYKRHGTTTLFAALEANGGRLCSEATWPRDSPAGSSRR